MSAGKVAREAMDQLAELTNHDVEGVVGVQREEENWLVTVEVLENERIPSTTDVLAEYEVELDDEGELLSYARTRRYVRGRARDE